MILDFTDHVCAWHSSDGDVPQADHLIVFYELTPEWQEAYKSGGFSKSPGYSDVVKEVHPVCIDCGDNYRSGYPCQMVHLDGSSCSLPFGPCSARPGWYEERVIQ